MKSTRTLRRISQWVVFLLFAFLFLNTEYKDNDVLPYAVNLFLRLDPLMAGAADPRGAGAHRRWSGPRWSSRSSRSRWAASSADGSAPSAR